MKRRRPCRLGCALGRSLGTTPECWELADKSRKAHRRHENAERRLYEKGIWPKTQTREEAVEHVRALYRKAQALDEEFQRKCGG